jgi:hypothetical protein
MHETFKTQLQAVSPLSTEPFEMDTEADPTVSQKVDSWSKYPSRFSKSQNRSLRTRKFKGIFDCRFSRTAADPGEALKVAREIEKLVCEHMSTGVTFSDSTGYSLRGSERMRISAADTTYSKETWAYFASYCQPTDSGLKESRPWRSQSTRFEVERVMGSVQ